MLHSPEVILVEFVCNGCASGAVGEEAEHANNANNINAAKRDLTERIIKLLIAKSSKHELEYAGQSADGSKRWRFCFESNQNWLHAKRGEKKRHLTAFALGPNQFDFPVLLSKTRKARRASQVFLMR